MGLTKMIRGCKAVVLFLYLAAISELCLVAAVKFYEIINDRLMLLIWYIKIKFNKYLEMWNEDECHFSFVAP